MTPPLVWKPRRCDDAAAARLETELGLSPVVARLLAIRGHHDPELADRFLRPTLSHLLDPWLMTDLAPAVERLLAAQPACMYLTHFGRVQDAPRLGRLFLTLLDGMVAAAQAQAPGPQRHAALKAALSALYLDSLREHGCTLPEARIAELLAIDLELNAQGIGVWLDRPAR